MKIELCSGIREHDMDLLFIEEFACSKAFAKMFMDKIGVSDYTIVNIIHSQYEEGNGIDIETQDRMVRMGEADADARGESDITVIYETGNQRRALLIEDKINASQQPGQRERYDARGNKGIKDGAYASYDVFMIAPESYIADNYENRVNYEEVRDYFKSKNDLRSVYKIALIEKALEKKRSSTHIMIPAEAVMGFYDSYVQCVKTSYPDLPSLITKAGQERGSKSNWIQYYSGIANVDLVHQALRQVVSIQINYGKDETGKKALAVRNWMEENVGDLDSLNISFNKNKSSVSLKYDVPMLDTGRSIYDQVEVTEVCFEGFIYMNDILTQMRSKNFGLFLSQLK